MPKDDAPGLTSVRIQRAMRLNSIEDGRLSHSTRLLDCAQRRSVTLMNQTVRLVHLSLDAINSSSGCSKEGEKSRREAREDLVPCFEYGERLFSRRFGKFRRAKTSVDGMRAPIANLTSGTDEVKRPLSPPPLMKEQRPVTSTSEPSRQVAYDDKGRDSSRPTKRRSLTAATMHSESGNHPHQGYNGPPKLTPPKSANPGFSRSSKPKVNETEDYGPRINSAIARVAAQAKMAAEVKDMLMKIRQSRSRQSTEDTAGYHERLLNRLPVEQLWSVRNSSPTLQLEVMDMKRAVQLVNQKQLNTRLQEFRSSCPLANDNWVRMRERKQSRTQSQLS